MLSETKSSNQVEVFWWLLYARGQEYQLMPVSWEGQTVLTDGTDWVVVTKGLDITLIRNLRRGEDTHYDYIEAEAPESKNFLLESEVNTRPLVLQSVELSVTRSKVGGITKQRLSTSRVKYSCQDWRYESTTKAASRLCSDGLRFYKLSRVEFDKYGDIISMSIDEPSSDEYRFVRQNKSLTYDEIKKFFGS